MGPMDIYFVIYIWTNIGQWMPKRYVIDIGNQENRKCQINMHISSCKSSYIIIVISNIQYILHITSFSLYSFRPPENEADYNQNFGKTKYFAVDAA